MQLPGVYVEIKGDYTDLQRKLKEARNIVTQQATGISNAINNALSPDKVRSSITGLVSSFSTLKQASAVSSQAFQGINADLSKLASMSGLTESQLSKLQSQLLRTQAANAQENALKRIATACNLTEQEVRELGAQFGLSAAQIGKITGKTAEAEKSMFSFASAAKLAFASISAYQIGAFVKSVSDAIIQVDSLNRSFAAISGSQAGAAMEMAFLRKTADETGQNFYKLADGYRQLTASTKGTTLEGEKTREVFVALSEAGSVLGLSQEKVELAIKAVAQMASKGTVQMEELKGQLGDSLPGAVQITARALGVTTDRLMKMAEAGELSAERVIPALARELRSLYSDASRTAALESAQSGINKMSEAWTDFKANIANSAVVTSTLGVIAGLMQAINKANAEAAKQPGLFSGEDMMAGAAALNTEETGLKRIADLRQKIADTEKRISEVKGNSILLPGAGDGLLKELNADLLEYRLELIKIADTQDLSQNREKMRVENAKRATEAAKEGVVVTEKQHQKFLDYVETERQALKRKYDEAVKGAKTDEEKALALQTYTDQVKKLDEAESKRRGADSLKAEKSELVQLNALIKNYTNEARDAAKASSEWSQGAEGAIQGMQRVIDQYATSGMTESAKLVYEQGRAFADAKVDIQIYEGAVASVAEKIAALSEAYKLASSRVEEAQSKLGANTAGTNEQDVNRLHELIQARDELGKQLGRQAALQDQLNALNRDGAMTEEEAKYAIYGTVEALRAKEQATIRDLESSANLYDNVRAGFLQVVESSRDAGREISYSIKRGFDDAADALTDFVMNGKMEISDLVRSIERDFLNMAIKKSVTTPLAGAFDSLLGSLGSFITGNAKGNIYSSPGLSAYSGKVVSSPTLFPFARGIGLMGEAGPEGILPLKRMKGGELGVRADGAASNVTVNVIESPGNGGQVNRRQEGGQSIIEVLVEQIKGSVARDLVQGTGAVPAAMGAAYGLRPLPGR